MARKSKQGALPAAPAGDSGGEADKAAWQAVAAAKKAFGRDGRRIALEDVVAKALTRAQLVFLGDTDHAANDLSCWLARPATMKSLAAHGVKAVYVETPKQEQVLYDALALGLIDEKQFARYGCTGSFFRDRKSSAAEDAAIIRAAAKEGIRVICADPGNGMPALARFHREMNAVAGRHHRLETYLSTDLVNRIFTRKFNKARRIADPEKAAAAQYGLADSFNRVSRHLDMFYRTRDDDRRLARLVAGNLGTDEKALIVYGAAHGRGKNGLRAAIARFGVGTLKIDVFRDTPALRSRFGAYAAGNIQANAAYVLSRGTLHSVVLPPLPAEVPVRRPHIRTG
jgi:hypothetical protein